MYQIMLNVKNESMDRSQDTECSTSNEKDLQIDLFHLQRTLFEKRERLLNCRNNINSACGVVTRIMRELRITDHQVDTPQ